MLLESDAGIAAEYGQVCESDFCQLLAALPFSADASPPDVLNWALQQRFPNERAFCELAIGQVQAIAARQEQCPSCRFMHSILQDSDRSEITPETLCYASFPVSNFRFSLAHRKTNGRSRYIMTKFGEQIMFLASETISYYDAGLLIDPKGVDYARIKAWLGLCEQLHQVCPQITTDTGRNRQNLLPRLRVVDIQEMCLTEIPWTERYVALSYVWGGATPPLLLKDDLPFWSTPGSVHTRYDQLPKSIQDSIEVVRRLEMEYFWFDSLCLLQDDPVELKKSINNMDMIYERAFVTIVAANSASANGGLPGVTASRLPQQKVANIKPGLSLVNVAPLDAHLKTSRWATRGWTLQEQHLSRRTLNFVNEQVYFRCRERIWAEDSCRDMKPKASSSLEWGNNYIALAREGMDEMEYFLQPYDFLFIALEEFQRRNLTVDNDALNAMAGFLQRVSEAGKTEMTEGVPAKLLPVALLFRNRVENVRYTRDVCRRLEFPSWSWAGWRAHSFWEMWKDIDITEGEDEMVDWLENANWIVWRVSQPQDNSVRTFHDPASIRQDFTADMVDRDAAAEGSLSVNARPIPALGGSQPSSLPSCFQSIIQESQSSTKSSIPANIPYSLLVFHTVSIHLTLGATIGDSYCRFHLLDDTGSECGEIIPDFMTADLPDLVPSAPAPAPALGALPAATPEPKPHEFILLSERYDRPNRTTFAPGDDEYDDAFANLIVKGTYWVMMVAFLEDKGVYERRGIGFVADAALQRSMTPGPVWKEVVLG